MSKIKLTGHASGSGTLTITGPNTSSDRTITLPDGDVTLGAATPSIDDNGNATAITIGSDEKVTIDNATAGVDVLVTEGNYASSGTVNLLKFQRDGGAVAGAIRYNDTNTNLQLGTTTTHSLDLLTDGSERLKITSDGRGLSQFTAFATAQLIDLTSTPAIQTSHNVSSVTDVSTGKFKCNFTNNTGGEKPTFVVMGQNNDTYDEIFYARIDASSSSGMEGGCSRAQASSGWHDCYKMNFIAFESD